MPLLLVAGSVMAWQQDVRYSIDVRLDTREHRLQGRETLWYRNNSPDTLDCIWFHLYPNAYRDRNSAFARELEKTRSYEFSFAPEKDRGWMRVVRVVSPAGGKELTGRDCTRNSRRADVTQTLMPVMLDSPLIPGDSTCLALDFEVKIPAFFSRLGHKGRHYVIAQWFPKPAVYEPIRDTGPESWGSGSQVPDARGEWSLDDYHLVGEFYGEFGSFDVAITVPAELVIGATGSLTDVQYSADANGNSDALLWSAAGGETQSAVAAEIAWMKLEPKKRSPARPAGEKTLRFRADNVHDFAWVADPDFVLKQDSWVRSGPDSEIPAAAHLQAEPGRVKVNVLVRQKNSKKWRDVPEFVRRTLEHYSVRYAPYPYSQITVVDARLEGGGGMEYPELVVIAVQDVSVLRLLEQVVMHEVGHQWFYGMLGSNEMAEAWLDEGINTFAEMRYMEETHGRRGNLTRYPRGLRFLPRVDDRYVQRLIYHVAATNGLLQPVLTPASGFAAEPVAYAATAYSQAGFMMRMLRSQVGDSVFDRVMQTYCTRFRFRHPRTEDFVQVTEEVSGQDLRRFFRQWLLITGTCDYALGKVRKGDDGLVVEVRRKGDVRMPVEIEARYRDGSKTRSTWTGDSVAGQVAFARTSGLNCLILDPDEKLLETDRWNNFRPRRVSIGPLIDLPSFERYQLFYGPYLWFDGYHGLQVGPWLMGRKFIDAGPLHGAHMWTVSEIYSTRLEDWETGVSYATPLSFISERLKFGVNASYALKVQARAGANLSWHFGPVLGKTGADLRLAYGFREIRQLDTMLFEPSDWVEGRVGRLEFTAGRNHLARCWSGNEALRFAWASPLLGSDSSYGRIGVELDQTWRPARRLRLRCRLFAGYAVGKPPPQEQFYLSGALLATGSEPITWSYKGLSSSQERWHIDGDANLRGYVTEHQRGLMAGGMNISLPTKYITPFFDIGNVGNSLTVFAPESLRMDAGVRVQLGPVYADFPIWANRPAQGQPSLAFRWCVGLSLSGVSIGF